MSVWAGAEGAAGAVGRAMGTAVAVTGDGRAAAATTGAGAGAIARAGAEAETAAAAEAEPDGGFTVAELMGYGERAEAIAVARGTLDPAAVAFDLTTLAADDLFNRISGTCSSCHSQFRAGRDLVSRDHRGVQRRPFL